MRADDEAAILACIPSLRRYARGLTGDPHRA
ncbi:RNA polymerase sigma factor, partial [Paraburkholderia sp. SIMBA_009]